MNKPKFGKDALLISVMTLMTVLTWLFIEIYNASNKSTITRATEKQMRSLNPKINTQVVQTLKNKISITEEEMDRATANNNLNLPKSATATPTSSVNTSTESATQE